MRDDDGVELEQDVGRRKLHFTTKFHYFRQSTESRVSKVQIQYEFRRENFTLLWWYIHNYIGPLHCRPASKAEAPKLATPQASCCKALAGKREAKLARLDYSLGRRIHEKHRIEY